MPKKISVLGETLLAGAVSAAVAGVLLSTWFLECCRPFIAGWPGKVFAPGMIVGMIIGGGAGRFTALDAGIGITLELMTVWGIFRWITRRRHLTVAGATDES